MTHLVCAVDGGSSVTVPSRCGVAGMAASSQLLLGDEVRSSATSDARVARLDATAIASDPGIAMRGGVASPAVPSGIELFPGNVGLSLLADAMEAVR